MMSACAIGAFATAMVLVSPDPAACADAAVAASDESVKAGTSVLLSVRSKGKEPRPGDFLVEKGDVVLGLAPLLIDVSGKVTEVTVQASGHLEVKVRLQRDERGRLRVTASSDGMRLFESEGRCARTAADVKVAHDTAVGTSADVELSEADASGPRCSAALAELQEPKKRRMDWALPSVGPGKTVKVRLTSDPTGSVIYGRGPWGRSIAAFGKAPRTMVFELYGNRPTTVIFKKQGYFDCVRTVTVAKEAGQTFVVSAGTKEPITNSDADEDAPEVGCKLVRSAP